MARIGRTRTVPPIGLLVCCLLTPSCAEQDQIRSYTIEPVAQRADSEPPGRDSAAETPQLAWFFKLLGPAEEVAERLPEFDALLNSVRFAGEEPEWNVPAAWTEQSGSGIRFATLVIPDTDPELEVAVTSLPALDPGDDVYLRQNIERWRGQVGLSAYQQADWRGEAAAAGELVNLTAGDIGMLRVNLLGATEEYPEARMLAAIVWKTGGTARGSAPPPDTPPLTYESPEQWSEASPRAFQLALFTVGDGENAAEVSISSAGGSLELNVNRWRNQVELAPLADSEVTDALETATVDGQPAFRTRIAGPEKSIIAVIVPDGQSNWFFKLIGPNELVERESARFDAFVESIQFAD